jgi:23S rRNA (cytosine1962-C5)-methyltransferase
MFADYELIDSGNFEKLERFGNYIIARPEPQALWDKSLSDKEWQQQSQAYFKLNKQNNQDSNERGEWQLKKGMPEQWFVNYSYKSMNLRMRLGLTSFKHVGLFPEQAENWDYIFDTIQSFKHEEVNVLNLFAYTGGASLAARAAGANVTHVDSVKQVISWSRENMEASKLDNIRWVVEDALKYVQREVKRGNKYNGIILDPPAYGRGPEGEKWVLENSLNDLLKLCYQLLKKENIFVLLNMYSMGFSQQIPKNLLSTIFNPSVEPETSELYTTDKKGRRLPLGIYSRFKV